MVQDAAGSHQCNECGYKKYIGHFKQHRKSTHEGKKEYATLVINVIIKEHPSHISQVMSNQFTKEYTTHVINVITRQQELDISTVIN